MKTALVLVLFSFAAAQQGVDLSSPYVDGAYENHIQGMRTTYKVTKAAAAAGAAVVEAGDTVTVHATGVVKETGKTFWSTRDPGQKPFTYQAGVGKVIKGWDQGCLGMAQGETRKLLIPATEGYGERGFPAWGIPPGGTLDFTIEVLDISKGGQDGGQDMYPPAGEDS